MPIHTVYASAARTATPAAVDVETGRAQGFIVVVDVTATADTPSVVVNIDGHDPVSAKQWTILDSSAITTTGTTVLRVGPSLTGSANVTAQDIVPPVVRVTPEHADASSITYSISLHTAD